MTFFRHFVERDDFVLKVATNSKDVEQFPVPYIPIRFDLPAWWKRLSNTRLHNWILGLQSLYGGCFLPKHVEVAARQFHPDLVFTMAGSWDWTALAAMKLAKRLRVPLVASFNDWYDYPWFRGHPKQREAIERRFRKFYKQSDLALCTSEGMKEALGSHPNSHVWYPAGTQMPPDLPPLLISQNLDRKMTVFFGGSLGEWHGPMLEELIEVCAVKHPMIRFRIFGSLAAWSSAFEKKARKLGIYGGLVSFEELIKESKKADLLLLLMGFDRSVEHIQRTSFKTKFLDYITFNKPILVWGPEYCSAVRVAREFDSAECVTDPKSMACASTINSLAASPARMERLVKNARQMYESRFNPNKIHDVLLKNIQALCYKSAEH